MLQPHPEARGGSRASKDRPRARCYVLLPLWEKVTRQRRMRGRPQTLRAYPSSVSACGRSTFSHKGEKEEPQRAKCPPLPQPDGAVAGAYGVSGPTTRTSLPPTLTSRVLA